MESYETIEILLYVTKKNLDFFRGGNQEVFKRKKNQTPDLKVH